MKRDRPGAARATSCSATVPTDRLTLRCWLAVPVRCLEWPYQTRRRAWRAITIRQLWPHRGPTLASDTRGTASTACETAGRWREDWDSNPGAGCPANDFQDRLGKLTTRSNERERACDLHFRVASIPLVSPGFPANCGPNVAPLQRSPAIVF